MEIKACSRCKRDLPVSEFYKRGDSYFSWCKDCQRSYYKAYHLRNKERDNKRDSQNYLMRTHGVGIAYKNMLLASQDYKCAICGERLERNVKLTHLDHNHETGEIRGVLCFLCNAYLGKYGDNIIGISKAIIAGKGKKKRLHKSYAYLLEAF